SRVSLMSCAVMGPYFVNVELVSIRSRARRTAASMTRVRYVPPPTWPPPPDWLPPADDWKPVVGWMPRGAGLKLGPDGTSYLLPSPPGIGRAPDEPSDDEQDQIHLRVVTRMLATWARAVRLDAHSYYQAAVRADWTDWAIERMEDWSPTTNDLARAMEE